MVCSYCEQPSRVLTPVKAYGVSHGDSCNSCLSQATLAADNHWRLSFLKRLTTKDMHPNETGGREATSPTQPPNLTDAEREEIADVLGRRANEVATFKTDLEQVSKQKFHAFPGSVELALSREVTRLRALRDKIKVPQPPDDDERD